MACCEFGGGTPCARGRTGGKEPESQGDEHDLARKCMFFFVSLLRFGARADGSLRRWRSITASYSVHMYRAWWPALKMRTVPFARLPKRQSLNFSSTPWLAVFVAGGLSANSEFRNAPPRAQSDLKKQLVILDVRKSIANAILASIGLADQDVSSMHSQSRPETLRPASSFSHYRHREEIERPKSVLAVRSHSHADASRDSMQDVFPALQPLFS